MNAVIAAAAELQAVCESEGWRFCLIGGIALQRWGEARETVDVDLTLLTGFGAEAPFIARLTRVFRARIDDASAFALANRVLRTCSAEDLIVLKAFADRPRDWADIEGILIRQTGSLDWGMVRDELAPLLELKESPESLDRLEQLRARLGA